MAQENALRRQALSAGQDYPPAGLRDLEEQEQELFSAEQKLSLTTALEPPPPADAQQAWARLRRVREKCEWLYGALPACVRARVAKPNWPQFTPFPADPQTAFVAGIGGGRLPYLVIASIAGLINLLPLAGLCLSRNDDKHDGGRRYDYPPPSITPLSRRPERESGAAETCRGGNRVAR